jgi:hypothetical protein
MNPPRSSCPLIRSPRKRAEADKLTSSIADQFPQGLAKPALRALANAGFKQLSDLRRIRESDLAKLHGIGPNAVRVLRSALDQSHRSFLAER